jgi:hypothetical protein
LAFLVVSCSTAPELDPLEAKAKAGDPEAACQFAIRELRNCAVEKQRWEQNSASEQPACMKKPLSEDAQSYLEHADVPKEGLAHFTYQVHRSTISLTAAGLLLFPAEDTIKSVDELEPLCAGLGD